MVRTMLVTASLVLAGSALAQSLPTYGGPGSAVGTDESTNGFTVSTSRNNSFETQENELAIQKGDDATAAMAAALMNDDKLNMKQLDQLTDTPPQTAQTAPKLSDTQKKQVDTLKSLNGTAFTSQYLQDAIAEERAKVARFQTYMQHGNNPQMRGWAGQNLPKLQYRLQQLEALERQNQ